MARSRVAVCSWSLRPRDANDLVDALRRVGVRCVQLALSPLACEDGGGDAYTGHLRDAGVEIVSGMMAFDGEDYSTLDTIARTGGVRPDDTWDVNRAHAEAVAAVAARLGLDLVTFHAGFIPDDRNDPERGKLLDRLGMIADFFATRGVGLALETGQETAATLVTALDDLDRPDVGVNFDPANMILYGKGDPVEALRRLAPRVRQIHIKDAVPAAEPGTWGRETPVGRGAVEWAAFLEIASSLAPAVDFVIEREAGKDRTADVIAARQLIVDLLAPDDLARDQFAQNFARDKGDRA